jgi:hypothetical protein
MRAVTFFHVMSNWRSFHYTLFAHKLVFLGRPAEVLAPQSHQELGVGCGEGFLGKAKNNR